MSYLKLIVTALRRQRVRTILTVASLAIAFLLLGLLYPVRELFTHRSSLAGVSRLVVLPKHSIADFLPVRAASRISEIAGVRGVAHQTWFGGTFRDPRNTFARWAVPPAAFLDMHPEMKLNGEQRAAFIATRTGAILGRATAEKFGLEIGDAIPLVPDIWPNKSSDHWEFQLVGVFDLEGAPAASTDMYINYDYFDEARTWGQGLVSYISVALENSSRGDTIAAQIDALFANSDTETRTASEQDYALSFAGQIGDVGLIVTGILSAVFFTIAMLTANTMGQAIRERTAEFAVLRTLGFKRVRIFLLVLAEALLISTYGAVCGIFFARLLIGSLATVSSQLAAVRLDVLTISWALLLTLLVALLAGVPPAWRASRLSIVDALRSQG